LPYGEPDNDWLRLDRRRVNNPTLRLSNNQILGWIQITGDGNPLLQDQTNREGLVTNGAYAHLQHVVLELLSYLEARRFATRRSADFTSSRTKSLLPPVVSTEADTHVEELLARFERRGGIRAGDVEALRVALQSQRQQAIASVRRYSGLAATGQLASLIFSRVAHPLRQMQTEISLLEADVASASLPEEDRGDLASTLERLRRRASEVKTALDRFDPIARPRQGRKLVPVNLQVCVDDVVAAFSDDIALGEVDVQVVPGGNHPVFADLSVAEQVLAILMQNACYWVCKTASPRTVRVVLREHGFLLENSGPPISADHRNMVFAPHFTTREDASGMGLTLARDLLEGIGSSIKCVPRTTGAAFEVTFGSMPDLPRVGAADA
jgi:signal transduction histidine kinase